MSLENEVYTEILLEHFKNPKFKGKLENFQFNFKLFNRLCGDEVEIYLFSRNQIVEKASFLAEGCSITLASASILMNQIQFKSIPEIKNFVEEFIFNMKNEKYNSKDLELESLLKIRKLPNRIECALLPWKAVLNAIKE